MTRLSEFVVTAAGFPQGDIVGTTDAQTLGSKTFSSYTELVYTITDGASVVLDPNDGPIQQWSLSANRTPDQANWLSGQSIMLLIDNGQEYGITWTPLNVEWKSNEGYAPDLNDSGKTIITLWKVGTQIYGARVGDA